MRRFAAVLASAAVVLVPATAMGAGAAATLSEREQAKRDTLALIAAYKSLARGGSGAAVCSLLTRANLRRLGGLAGCMRFVGPFAKDSETRKVLLGLRIKELHVYANGGRRMAAVVLLPRPEGGPDYWQWVLMKEGGRYRLHRDVN
jgi:hypothetical protein